MTSPSRPDQAPEAAWLLVLGGATTAGRRRALDVVHLDLMPGAEVWWLDGADLPLDVDDIGEPNGIIGGGSDRTLLVWACGSDLGKAIADRRLVRFGSGLGTSEALEPLRRIGHQVAQLAKRAGGLARGREYHQLVDQMLTAVAVSRPPSAVIHCDDVAVAAAWHLARRWPAVPCIDADHAPSLLDEDRS